MSISDNKQKEKQIWLIKTWIRSHLNQTISVEELADRCGLSVRQFYREFSRVTGEPPAEHIQRLRLSVGASLLAYSNASVVDAALAAGYESREAFTRLFTQHYGCSPKLFRKSMQNHIEKIRSMPMPEGLSVSGVQLLPAYHVAAWPHLGHPLASISSWLKLGLWARPRKQLGPNALPISIIYDDGSIMPPGSRERYDAALVLDDALQGNLDAEYIEYEIPGGDYAIAHYSGTISNLDAAFDHFCMVWFFKSGLQLRDNRFLIIHDPGDVPTGPIQIAKILAGRRISCRLCIPVDTVAGSNLPIISDYRFLNKETRGNARH